MFIFSKGLLLWLEGIMRAIEENVFNYNDPGWPCIRHTIKPKTKTTGYLA